MFERLRKRDGGAMSGVEFGIVSVLAGISFVAYNAASQDLNKESLARLVADDLKAFHLGCGAYIRDTSNTGDVWNNTSLGPINITPATLTAKLMTGWNDRSPIGQQYMCSVKRTDGSLEYVSFNYGGSNVLDDVDLNIGAFRIGTFGGAVTTRHATEIVMTKRLADQLKSNFDGPAVVVSTSTLVAVSKYGIGGLSGDHVNRNAVPGLPEANTMNAELIMNGVDISGPLEIRPDGTLDGEGIDSIKTATLTKLSATTADGTAATDATANTIAYRDADGRMKAATPVDGEDVANMNFVLAQAGGGGPCGSDPEIGDMCSDGFLMFAGNDPFSGKGMFVDPTNSGVLMLGFPSGIDNWTHEFVVQNTRSKCGQDTPSGIFTCLSPETVQKAIAYLQPDSVIAYCQNMTAGGYSDWFLPMPHQFVLLVMGVGNAGGFVDLRDTAEKKYWMGELASSSSWTAGLFNYLNSPSVNFPVSHVRYPHPSGATMPDMHYAKCIRSE